MLASLGWAPPGSSGVGCFPRFLHDCNERTKRPRSQQDCKLSVRRHLNHDLKQRLDDRYDVNELLGEGGFGKVFAARIRGAESQSCAIKKVDKGSTKCLRQGRREVLVLGALDHPSVCRLLATFEDERVMYIVLEHLGSRNLFDEMSERLIARRSFDEALAIAILTQVFDALDYCHKRTVIHRDLKPENVMVLWNTERTIPKVKLIDFGASIMNTSDCKLDLFCGTREYCAPEARSQGAATFASDMWSVGIILFVMLMGRFPHSDREAGHPTHGSRCARHLASWLLAAMPDQRASAAQAMDHSWLKAPQAIGADVNRTWIMRIAPRAFGKGILRRYAAGKQVESTQSTLRNIGASSNGGVTSTFMVSMQILALVSSLFTTWLAYSACF